ncbi:hypothetical protein [Amycolatopsis taiwanensis]|uniref:hypothetical protein n=1 Tax=Amycolatopsis taiwanensis TaxID=342230 RepID=UPI0004805F1E|nr:hypothetical protein [Amycolatopsis taiwanensis]
MESISLVDTSTDPIPNIVLFVAGAAEEEPLEATVGARDADGIRKAWQQVASEHAITAGQVTQIHSMWEPSVPDKEYAERTFPGVELTAAFPRPAEDGWDEAFVRAQQVMDEANEARGEDVDGEPDGALMPLLRSASSPGNEQIQELMPHFFLIPDGIYATLARVGWTPHGTIGMLHLLHQNITEQAEFEAQVAQAMRSMSNGLTANYGANDEGDELIVVSRRDELPAAGALCLDGFHEWISGIRGWQDLTVAIICPERLLITPTGTAQAEMLRREVMEADDEHLHNHPELLPSLLRVTSDGMELVAEAGYPAL